MSVAPETAPHARTPPAFGRLPVLTPSQADEYLARIDLDAETMRRKPLDYRTLAELHLAHLLTVPFDNTQMHMADEDFMVGTSKRLDLGSGPGISCSIMSAFHAIVQQRRGGYCFVCNSLFSALLRHLGFTVSEVGARVNGARNTAASDNGYQWTGISHMALLVDVEDDRFLCDVGFGGGGSEHPVKLRDASQMRSVTASESFELRNETLPGADPVAFRDLPKGWTLYRHFKAMDGKPAFESACYHFLPYSLVPADWAMLNHFNSHARDAPFAKRCVVSRLRADGRRDVFLYIDGDEHARYYLRDGNIGTILEEERLEPTIGGVIEILRRKFGVPMRPRTMSRIHSA